MRCAYQLPRAAHLVHAAQQELPEALPLFDLTEDWLDVGFSTSIDRWPRHGRKFVFHSVDPRGGFWNAPARAELLRFIVHLLAGRHISPLSSPLD